MQDSKAKILLVDDDPSIRLAVSDWLQMAGYDVVEAESAEQALGLLDTTQPDLTLLDLNMPGMGGVGFLREMPMANERSKYPVLVFSANPDTYAIVEGLPVDGVVPKFGSPRRLLAEVARTLSKCRQSRRSSAEFVEVSDEPDLNVMRGVAGFVC